ncbi:MAG: exodeoxyribonuclease VII large subunit [Bacillota bacterium]|nr:exodeoxyribonuclease VII large subunit [Bacillota bacterium]
MYIKTLTVTSLNNYIKKIIENDFILNNTYIKGEISNFKFHSSGHLYFSLKDVGSKINCIMFKSQAEHLEFLPENGMNVVVKGRVSVYSKDGVYQLYCDEIKLDGIGELYAKFERMKNKLQQEGLFDEKYKKPIPKYPRRIGVITSPTGAAIRDIINVSKRRHPNVNLLIYPALVQGMNAPEDLIKGIKAFEKMDDLDVIILARGGGSIEELWAFNDESLAYQIFNCKKPIITGVGHETDFTIVDFVSDKRAPTPSAAAELAVPNLHEVNSHIINSKQRLSNNLGHYIQRQYNNINILKSSLEKHNPMVFVVNQYKQVDMLKDIMKNKIRNKFELERHHLARLNAVLDANNPLNVLGRGYAVIKDAEGNLITSVKKMKHNGKISLALKDGNINARIEADNDVN